MAKRMQEQKGEERIVAKSMPTMDLAHLSLQILRLCRVRLRQGAWEYSRHPVKMIGQVQGDLEQENSIKTQRRVLKKWPKRCSSGLKCEETRGDRRSPGTPEFPWRFKKYEETRRVRKLRHQRQRQNLATPSPCIYRLRTAHGEGFLDYETKIWSQSERQDENLDVKAAVWGILISATLQAAVHIGTDYTENLRSTTRTHWDSCSKWLGSWSPTKLKLLVLLRLIGTSSCGERRPCWLTRLVQFATAKIYVLSAMSGRHPSRTS